MFIDTDRDACYVAGQLIQDAVLDWHDGDRDNYTLTDYLRVRLNPLGYAVAAATHLANDPQLVAAWSADPEAFRTALAEDEVDGELVRAAMRFIDTAENLTLRIEARA